MHVRRRFAATAIRGRPAEGRCCAEMKNRSSPTDAEKIENLAMATIEEARMVLPGIQALFGFQLIVAFNEHFRDLEPPQQVLHFVSLVLVALAIAIIVTPAAYHHLAERGSI